MDIQGKTETSEALMKDNRTLGMDDTSVRAADRALR